MLYDWSMDSNCSTSLGSKNLVVCARVGGANTTPLFLAAHFAKRNTKFGGGGKRGRAKIPSPQPPFFLPAPAVRFRSSARTGGSPRRGESRLAVGQDEVRLSCDFNSVSDLLCPIIL